ncbi:hypothetical protein P1J78_19800 [Psychromarinibacter sp. C21-152]|uniref:tRNA nuclease CdiA C-terminal domain-containing protein n=1 Tax=Psychromarinibacter sediminicola TaxID=3033385 RepID=A0AAE3TBF9_9RHOB|nr:hypothetical protein [Psychromarinibacter sediminicola]
MCADFGAERFRRHSEPGGRWAQKNPDYLINGEVYDHYAPSTDHSRRIWERVQEKVEAGQAPNIVIGLQDSNVEEDALRQQFENWPIEGLGDVIIIRPDGTIGRL